MVLNVFIGVDLEKVGQNYEGRGHAIPDNFITYNYRVNGGKIIIYKYVERGVIILSDTRYCSAPLSHYKYYIIYYIQPFSLELFYIIPYLIARHTSSPLRDLYNNMTIHLYTRGRVSARIIIDELSDAIKMSLEMYK